MAIRPQPSLYVREITLRLRMGVHRETSAITALRQALLAANILRQAAGAKARCSRLRSAKTMLLSPSKRLNCGKF
jgi:hypothetical protein